MIRTLNRDIAPEGATLVETNAILDRLVDRAETLQKTTGVKLLWNTCNLFAHSRWSLHFTKCHS